MSFCIDSLLTKDSRTRLDRLLKEIQHEKAKLESDISIETFPVPWYVDPDIPPNVMYMYDQEWLEQYYREREQKWQALWCERGLGIHHCTRECKSPFLKKRAREYALLAD